MPSETGPFLSATCPYFARFQPRGRDHTYDLCEATGEEPLVPSQSELRDLCHGDFRRCAHFQAARRRDEVLSREPDKRAA